PNTLAALADNPDLGEDRSAVLDLAYEEFCLRRDKGETLDIEDFCARFPHCRSYLRHMLLADQMIAEHPSSLDHPVPELDDWPQPGDVVRKCTLLRELGRGTFARVYLALEEPSGNRVVALKLSRLASNEARTLGPLSHDHVVPIHWADHDDSTGYHIVC